MKAGIFLFLVLCIGVSLGEITPNFPGNQPILVYSSGNSTSNTTVLEIKEILDLFSVDAPSLIIEYPSTASPSNPFTATQFTADSSVLGGERDIILNALTGPAGRVLTAGVSSGTFSLATPNGASGQAIIQYDGIDGSPNLNTNPGLGELDFTANNAQGFAFNASSDVPTNFNLTIVSTTGSFSVQRSVQGSLISDTYLIPYTEFQGVDFTRVVAIQFTINALENVDFIMDSFVTYGEVLNIPTTGIVRGSVLPCNMDYYRIQTLEDVTPGTYLRVHFNQTGEPDHLNSLGAFYIVSSVYDDLQSELETNINVVDTLGKLPGPHNYLYSCTGSSCDIEITCNLESTTYYIGIEGSDAGILLYEFYVYISEVSIYELFNEVPQVVIQDRRPTTPPEDHIYYYRYFAIEVPEAIASEGTYLVVNISRVQPLAGLDLYLNYGGIAEFDTDSGVIGEMDGGCYWKYCVAPSPANQPQFEHPINTQQRQPCHCKTAREDLINNPNGPFQMTCQLTVDPCTFRYGTWYASVLLPIRDDPANPNDTSGYANYTITAYIVQPEIIPLEKNITVKGSVVPEAATHYSLWIPATDSTENTHLFVQISNIRNGFVDVWIHRDVGAPQNLAGGLEACLPANVTCHTSEACNLVVEKCHFEPGMWYISVSISYMNEEFQIIDWSRLPITYTLRATWMDDTAPVPISAGIPVMNFIGESLYDFYVLDVPPTIDTWLFIELYVKSSASCDTGVILSVLHGELPGGECYSRPDFYCSTGDPSGVSYTTMPPTNMFIQPNSRKSCNFIIQTCQLQTGPLYFSVYGHHIGYSLFGDNTYYQLPVEYTLYVDFDTALAVQSGVSYSETVYEKQYQHYYIRADYLAEGQYMSVEACNIQHAIPQSIEVFVNYNYMAGNCPCYDHLYNATGIQDPLVVREFYDSEIDTKFLPDVDTVATCSAIIIPPCAFRSGIWYIGILGKNQDSWNPNLAEYGTPIGYTLTVTVHDAPIFEPLILGQSQSGTVPQWNKTLEYTHFKLAADPIPLSDLVIKLTYTQNCEYQEKHDNLRDTLALYVNKGGPAGDDCYQYHCEANMQSESYCTIIIPHCEWVHTSYFIAVQGNYDSDFLGRFTIRAYIDEVREIKLSSGVAMSDRVSEGLFKHYFLDVSGNRDEYLAVFFYANNDYDTNGVDVYLNFGSKGGSSSCFDQYLAACFNESCCTMQVENYMMQRGRYYISVHGAYHQFYEKPIEYTLIVSTKPVITSLSLGDPLTGSVEVEEIQHYVINIDDFTLDQDHGDYLVFEIEVGCSHGSVVAYYEYETMAGRVPGYLHYESCYATPIGTRWCEIRIPSCEMLPGNHFFSIKGLEYIAGSVPFYATAIGYTLEVNLIKPLVVAPTVIVGREIGNTEYDQMVWNGRFNHYQFPVMQTDLDAGYHWIVEITDVHNGALRVFYQPGAPADFDPSCHLAEICTSGLSTGRTCYWQIPYSTVRVIDGTTDYYEPNYLHYVSIYAIAGREPVSYDILIWKQPVPAIIENPLFTLDNANSSFFFPSGAELNVTHLVKDEPNNWVQFIKLSNVPAHDDEGTELQVFFYRIQNNVGNSMSFKVYLHPNEPAGSHECCDTDLGSCQTLPTQRTVELTTNTGLPNFEDEYPYTYTCDLPVGSGPQTPDGNDPFYGERCTVTVWPCEFSRYCHNETVDWWLTIVPIEYSANASPTLGLSYSVQWRVHNTRLDGNISVGTESLDEYLNTYEYTPTFTVARTSTEDFGWRSFSLTAPSDASRLVIQTNLINGSSNVYIQGDSFASPIRPNDCYLYSCDSNCDTASGRFVIPDCRFQESSIYYITVLNVGEVGSYAAFSFRIVAIFTPGVLEIPENPMESSPFIGTSGFNSQLNLTGVEGEGYNFYVLPIDDNDLDFYQTLIINLEMINSTATDQLELYFRLGAPAGNSNPDHCYEYQVSCAVTGNGNECTLQIPHSNFVQGFWYISVYNPNFNYGPGAVSSLPDYILTVWLQQISALSLGVSLLADNETENFAYPGIYDHYYINITQSDIDYDTRSNLQGYYTKSLRFYVTINGNPDFSNVYVNYGNLAGVPVSGNDMTTTYGYLILDTYTENNLIVISAIPCGEQYYLRTGMWFISIRNDEPITYNITVTVENELYDSISPQIEQGVGNRAGTTNTFWRHTVTQAELTANGDGLGNYRYVIDTSVSIPDDDIIDSDYFYVNITLDGNTTPIGNNEVSLLVWRDDCNSFKAEVGASQVYRVIDAITLAPCSIKGGRFYFRVENPGAINFTLTLHQNQTTIQTIQDHQIITEIIYPYEYQEYFYDARQVVEGATLTARVCTICGETETFIRADLPAGPGGGRNGDDCQIDYCSSSGRNFYSLDDDNDEQNCCVLFLDTCQYEQRGYYVAVRGVSTNFPNSVNEHLYIPATYQIQIIQTNIQIVNAPFVCSQTVSYYEPPSHIPRQFAFDLESMNVGGLIRVSMALPYQYVAVEYAKLSVSHNNLVGYTSSCRSEWYCEVQNGISEYLGCYTIINHASPGRYYVWADAPRGTEVIVEKWDPYIPIIDIDRIYHGTINGINSNIDIEFPFAPSLQYYRFNYGPIDDEDSHDDDYDHFYDKFFVRVKIFDVKHGSLSASVNTGFMPYLNADDAFFDSFDSFYNSYDCAIATDGYDCRIEIQRPDVNFFDAPLDDHDEYYCIPYNTDRTLYKTFWIVINGMQQECENHAIEYSLLVQTTWDLTYFPTDRTIANSVAEDDYNFHRLRLHTQESPQLSYLSINLWDIDVNAGEEVQLYLKDDYIPTRDSYDFSVRSSRADSPDVPEGSISFDWLCGYENLYLSVYGINSADGIIDYAMSVDKIPYPVKVLYDSQVYRSDDDDDDMCPHPYDIYYFRAVAPNGNYDSAFLRVLVESDYPFEVYVNKGSFAWKQCHLARGSAARGSLDVYDFCHYEDGEYYITVVSQGPYYIFTRVVDTSVQLTLGQVYRDQLELGQYRMYTLSICKDWIQPDDRLVVEIADIQYGNVEGWIKRDANPGFQNTNFGSCDCHNVIDYQESSLTSGGYNFLKVDHSELSAGTYHILIHAMDTVDDDNDFTDDDEFFGTRGRGRTSVTYRLLAYLEDLEIDPISIAPNSQVSGIIDYYMVDRFSANSIQSINYYEVFPLISGYENGIAMAQIFISNVQGGILSIGVMCGHLATPSKALIPGDIIGLVHDYQIGYVDDSNMRSGRFPWNVQYIMDDRSSRYQLFCTGSADFCEDLSDGNSLSLWLSSCYFDLSAPLYIYVEAEYQDYRDHSISYDIEVQQYVDFVLLKPNTQVVKSMSRHEHHLYRSLQAKLQSARWRVVVLEGEGVTVTVRNHRCPRQATWERTMWCDADYFHNKYICDIEIPTEASHPGDNVFFIDVEGTNATYSLSYWRGRENCHEFYQEGRSEGLNFCAGLVNYATWRWDDYADLDSEAECFFNDLYNHFRVQPCWAGVTSDCNSTLRQFACYESFRACDEVGFYVGTCKSACNAVAYECVNWFESVNLEHFNCSSSRYIEDAAGYCTGYGNFPTFNPTGSQNFFGDAQDIIYMNKEDQYIPQFIHEI